MNMIPFSSHWICESYLSTKASILTFRACMSVHFTLHYNFLWPPIKVSIGLWIQAMMCGFQLECIPISAVIWYPKGRYFLNSNLYFYPPLKSLSAYFSTCHSRNKESFSEKCFFLQEYLPLSMRTQRMRFYYFQDSGSQGQYLWYK